MILLAVETTSSTGSLVLSKIDRSLAKTASAVLAERTAGPKGACHLLGKRAWTKKSTHSEVITLELQSALAEADVSLDQITHFAIDVGPGSFTGIRVGINLIRTLAYATGKPVRSFCSLEVLAFQNLVLDESSETSAVVAIPALQEYFYAAVYTRDSRSVSQIQPPQSLDRGALEELSRKTKAGLQILEPLPTAETITSMVAADPSESHFHSWNHVLPLYIRKSEAEEKLRKGLLKPLR